MKTKAITAAVLLAATITAWLYADEITGNIRVAPSLTHTGTGISDLTETISDVWKWAGASSAVGTNGTATALTCMYVGSSNGIPAGATGTVDICGAVADSFGKTFSPVKIKGFIFCPSNSMVAPQSMLIRPAPENGWATWMSGTTTAVRAWAGGCVAFFAPNTNAYAVTAGTGDLLETVNESTNACSYRLYLFGE